MNDLREIIFKFLNDGSYLQIGEIEVDTVEIDTFEVEVDTVEIDPITLFGGEPQHL